MRLPIWNHIAVYVDLRTNWKIPRLLPWRTRMQLLSIPDLPSGVGSNREAADFRITIVDILKCYIRGFQLIFFSNYMFLICFIVIWAILSILFTIFCKYYIAPYSVRHTSDSCWLTLVLLRKFDTNQLNRTMFSIWGQWPHLSNISRLTCGIRLLASGIWSMGMILSWAPWIIRVGDCISFSLGNNIDSGFNPLVLALELNIFKTVCFNFSVRKYL